MNKNTTGNSGLLQWRGSGTSEMAQVVVLKFLAIFVMAWSWLVATESKPRHVSGNRSQTVTKIE